MDVDHSWNLTPQKIIASNHMTNYLELGNIEICLSVLVTNNLSQYTTGI